MRVSGFFETFRHLRQITKSEVVYSIYVLEYEALQRDQIPDGRGEN